MHHFHKNTGWTALVAKRIQGFGVLLLLLHLHFAYAASPSPVGPNDWALKIVNFDVGQGDGAALITRDGFVVLVDMGHSKKHGDAIAKFFLNKNKNGVGVLTNIHLLFASHYDSDHIGGASALVEKFRIGVAFDQGPSVKRSTNKRTVYSKYLKLVGDPNGNSRKDPGETRFVRNTATYGRVFNAPPTGLKIAVVSVNGNTRGEQYDLPLNPTHPGFDDENPGSIILYITFGEFSYLTGGDATTDDWKHEPDTEEALVRSKAVPTHKRLDILKVSHHGSDTSSARYLCDTLNPYFAIISSDLAQAKLPKLTTIKTLELGGTQIYVTGRARTNLGEYHQAKHTWDDGYKPRLTKDKQGTITTLVSADGKKFSVYAANSVKILTFYKP